MAPKAQQVDFLLSQVRNSTGSLASGTVTFYAAGTTTLKTIWTDRDEATPAANPYTLDANGTAQLYASGLYKVLIKNAAGTTIYTRDNLYFEFSPSDDIDALQYSPFTFTQATIEAALTATGTVNKATLLLRPGTWVISSNADWSAYTNVTFKIVPGAILSHGAYTVKMPYNDFGFSQVLSGTGVVTFNGQIGSIKPQWFGARGNGVDDDYAAINSAIIATPNGATLYFPATPNYYRVLDTPTVTGKAIKIKGDGWRLVPGGGVQGSIIRQEGGVTKDALLLDGTVSEIDGMVLDDIALGGTAASRYALHFEGSPTTGVNRSIFRNVLLAGAGTAGMYTNGLSVLNKFDHVILSMGFTSSAGYAIPAKGFHLRASSGNSVWTACGAAGVTTGVGYAWHLDGAGSNLFLMPEAEGNTVGWRFDGGAGGNIFISPYHEANGTVFSGTPTKPTNLSISTTEGSSTTLNFTADVGSVIVASNLGSVAFLDTRATNFVSGGLLSPHTSPKGALHGSRTGVTSVWNTSVVEGGVSIFGHTDTSLADVAIAEFQATGVLTDSMLKIGSNSANLGDVGFATYRRSTGASRNIYIKNFVTDVIATASLPGGAASENGRVLIEDAGAGDRNLIIYGGGQRFRIDGGAAF